MNPTGALERATAAVDATISAVRHDITDPTDLSAVIAGLRELLWHTTTLSTVIANTYDGRCFEHDTAGVDPAHTAGEIVARLDTIRGLLARVDHALGDAHNHAAHLRAR
jgi:hypothetical protein